MKDGLEKKEDYEGGGLIRSAGGLKEVLKRKEKDKQVYDERILGNGMFVEKVLRDINEESDKINIKIKEIEDLLERLGEYYNISKQDILSSRVKEVRKARDIFVYLGNIYLKKSLKYLGDVLGITEGASSLARKRGLKIFKEDKRVLLKIME